MELKPIVKEWLEALRSGTLVQTKDVLGKEDGSRCCLGVACDIAVKHGIIPPPVVKVDPFDNMVSLGYGAEETTGGLPEVVRQAFGMTSRIGSYLTEEQKERKRKKGFVIAINCLAQDNDSHGKTFSEIADIIEANADQLFLSPVQDTPYFNDPYAAQ